MLSLKKKRRKYRFPFLPLLFGFNSRKYFLSESIRHKTKLTKRYSHSFSSSCMKMYMLVFYIQYINILYMDF